MAAGIKLPFYCVDSKKTAAEKADEDDAKILAAIANQRKLASDLELAKGIQYTDSLKTTYDHSYVFRMSLLLIFILQVATTEVNT